MGQYRLYANFRDAMIDCTVGGYQHPRLVDVIFRKTQSCLEQLGSGELSVDPTSAHTAVALLQIASPDRPLRVLDLGGACGLHFFISRVMLPEEYRLDWTVVETPAMADRARALERTQLRFFGSLEEAIRSSDGYDLVYTSGALQCVEHPYEMLDRIVGIGAPYLMFARAGFVRAPRDLIVVHSSRLKDNGRGPMPAGIPDEEVRYPFAFLSLDRFLGAVTPKYGLLMQFDDNSGVFPVNNEEVVGLGMLFCSRGL